MTTTLAAVATEFLQRPGLALGTVRSYESTLMPLLQEYGRLPIEILTRQAIQEYLNSLNHIAFTTHHRHQAIIQDLLNFAVEQGYIKANPIAGLKRRKPDKERGEHDSDEVVRYLTSEQLAVLYRTVRSNARINTLVHLLHRTGARISEVLALDLEEVNLVQRKFQVVGKGNRQRWCFYSEDAATVLDHYLTYSCCQVS
jgi:integrase/recombinase XerD